MIYCDNCGLANRDGSRFCNDCGHRLGEWITCGHCDFQNPVTARYCNSCGERTSRAREDAPGQQQTGRVVEPAVGAPPPAKTAATPMPLLLQAQAFTALEEEPPLENEIIAVSDLLSDVAPEVPAGQPPAGNDEEIIEEVERLEVAEQAPAAAMQAEQRETQPSFSASPAPPSRWVDNRPATPYIAANAPAPAPSAAARRTTFTPTIALARSGQRALVPVPAVDEPSTTNGEAVALMKQIAAALQTPGNSEIRAPRGRRKVTGVLIGALILVILALAAFAAMQIGLLPPPDSLPFGLTVS